ncbi:MAG: class I SAM-dependent methyltransferase [Pseudomonadota bacterium]
MSTDQYDAYPYPARDPKDERKRLVTGSPSHPREIDTHLFGGKRDWRKPFRALVAGGGTGDALVQMAQVLHASKAPYEITYLDLSSSARAIAEARIKERRLPGVTFKTGSLLEADALGPFDYIDCCGVLHHLEDPVAGLRALEGALAPGAGIGFMVYAPYGRSGVYPLQDAFRGLFKGLSPSDRLARAKEIMGKVPEGHPFRRNPHLGDHLRDEAGFYDLLLHEQDRAFAVDEWIGALGDAGLALTNWVAPALYDLSMITPPPEHLGEVEAMALAEKLRGSLTKHLGYAQRAGERTAPLTAPSMSLVPHLDAPRKDVAQAVAAGKQLQIKVQGVTFRLKLPQSAAGILARVNGQSALGDIAGAVSLDAVRFQALWVKIHAALMATGTLTYSSLKAR